MLHVASPSATRHLLQIILKAGPGVQLPTFLELCEALQICKGTLNGVLAELERQDVITRRHGIGIFVSERMHRRFLLLCPSQSLESSVSFWHRVFGQIDKEADEHGYLLEVKGVPPEAECDALLTEIESLILDKHIQGVIAFGQPIPIVETLSASLPLVSFASYAPCMVSLDLNYCLWGGIWHLASLGSHRIALWDIVPPAVYNDPGKWAGHALEFQRALRDNDMSFEPGLIQAFLEDHSGTAEVLQQQGYERARQVFRDPAVPPPDGIYIGNDYVARGAVQALDEMGVRVGEHVNVVAYSHLGSDTLLSIQNRIVLMQFDTALVARELIEMLIESINNKLPFGGHRYVRPRQVVPEKFQPSV